MKELLIKLKAKSQSPFVFTSESNKPMTDISWCSWYPICKNGQFKRSKIHELQHNWASRHAEAGTDIIAIKELDGWKILAMVKWYTHPSIDYLHRQAQNIEAQTSDLGRLFKTKNVTRSVTKMAESRLTIP